MIMEKINLIDLLGEYIKPVEVKDGEPCPHSGCLHHVTYPCEVCGRINCKGDSIAWKVINNASNT